MKKNEVTKQEVTKQKDSIFTKNEQISRKQTAKTEFNSITNLTEIGKAYVTARNGLTYREKPDINSTKLGTFDFGTELAIVEKTGIEFEIIEKGEKLNGQWLKVKSKIDRTNNHFRIGKNYKHLGFVFSGFLIDSIDADFSKIPIQFDYASFPNNVSIKQKNTLKFSFVSISKSDFELYKINYDDKIVIDSTKKAVPGKYVLLKTSNSYFKLPCSIDYNPFYDYEGFLKPLNTFIIGHSGSIGETILLDKKTDRRLYLISPFDDGNSGPLISPNNDKLLGWGETVFRRESFIALYDLNGGNRITDIKYYNYFHTEEWRIFDLVWIDNKSLALRVYDDDRTENGKTKLINERFLKATLE